MTQNEKVESKDRIGALTGYHVNFCAPAAFVGRLSYDLTVTYGPDKRGDSMVTIQTIRDLEGYVLTLDQLYQLADFATEVKKALA